MALYNWASGSITFAKEKLDISPKSNKQVLALLRTQLDIEECQYHDVDSVAQSILQITNDAQVSMGNPELDLSALQYYVVKKNKQSEGFYKYFTERYALSPKIYIFSNENTGYLKSNCELLSTKLKLLKGISAEQVWGKTVVYQNFLIAAEMYGALIAEY